MLYKAKQLHLLIMRGLAQDGHRDYDGKTAQQHFSMAVAPAWSQGFSNGAFRKHLWYHRNSLPWEGAKVVLLCAGQLVDVVFLLSLFHTTTVADLALLISSPLT